MPRKSKTKATGEGIAPTIVLSEEPRKAGYVTGRPTEYKQSYCDSVVEWGKAGKSITWMAAEIGVCKDTIYEWINVHQEFSDAIKRAKVLCQQWWEDAGQSGMVSDKFNSAVWAKNMAARFRDEWTERSETAVTGPNGGPVVVERHIVDPTS
jgi:hypothetical protein